MAELKDTVDGMLSADYKERFKAEYQQTEVRYHKLACMLDKHSRGVLEFEPACPINLLREQHEAMGGYIDCLKRRVLIEGIEL